MTRLADVVVTRLADFVVVAIQEVVRGSFAEAFRSLENILNPLLQWNIHAQSAWIVQWLYILFCMEADKHCLALRVV